MHIGSILGMKMKELRKKKLGFKFIKGEMLEWKNSAIDTLY